jgi:hypothetical protein
MAIGLFSWKAYVKGPILSGLLVALVLCLTVLLVLALGILTAYTMVNGILYAFAYQSRQRTGTPVLIPSQTHAGD